VLVHLVRLPVLHIELAAVAQVLAEQLGQVVWLSVRDGPSEFGWVEFWLLILSPLFWSCFLFFTLLLRLGFLDLDLLNNWLLPHVGSLDVVCGLLFVLKADHADDLADILLNSEEFVHLAHLQGLGLLHQFASVAEAFQKDEALVGT